jgi:hypothetical protein
MERPVALLVAASAAFALCPSISGCGSTATTPPYVPLQGIAIDSAALVGPYGCGTGPGQVYRYVATVSALLDSGAEQVVATGVFDCFADGVFEIGSVAPPDAGNLQAAGLDFVVTIYAFSAASLPASLACDSSPCIPPQLEAGAYVPGYGWTTTCTATEVAGAPVTAQCGALVPYGGADAGAHVGADFGDAKADAPRGD